MSNEYYVCVTDWYRDSRRANNASVREATPADYAAFTPDFSRGDADVEWIRECGQNFCRQWQRR